MPILTLCFCNSWITIAISRAKRNSKALFQSVYIQTYRYNNNSQIEADNKSGIIVRKRKSLLPRRSLDTDLSISISMKENNNRKSSTASAYGTNSKSISSRGGAMSSSSHHISIMLLTISIGFIVLNLPFAIHTIFHKHYSSKFKVRFDYDDFKIVGKASKEEALNSVRYFTVYYSFFDSISHFLRDLNFIANFFFYFFSGSRFRNHLFNMFSNLNYNKKKTNARKKQKQQLVMNHFFMSKRLESNNNNKKNNNNAPQNSLNLNNSPIKKFNAHRNVLLQQTGSDLEVFRNSFNKNNPSE